MKSTTPQFLSDGRWLTPLLLGILLVLSPRVHGQKPAGAGAGNANLPDSPQPKQPAMVESSGATPQRFIGYVSNKSLVFPDIAASEGPLPISGKFKIFVNQSISPPYVFGSSGFLVGSQGSSAPPHEALPFRRSPIPS